MKREVSNDDYPPLMVRALMADLEDLAKRKELPASRVAYKRNEKGEHVIALIVTRLS